MADDINFQIPAIGYGAYLENILPEDQAVLAGAFSTSMQQIKNITNLDSQVFGQVVFSIETNQGLPLTNGTNVPVNDFLTSQALIKVALGTGLYGTYTTSDFMGAMTGLPYPVEQIYDGIKQLQTNNLIQIYQNLYLAVKWEQALVEVQCSDDGFGNYTPIGLTLTNQGGGYGREGATAPVITLSNGGTGTCIIGTDPDDLATYGKVISVTLISPGSTSPSCPTAIVTIPPDNGTGGWPGMNSVIQTYVDAADNEIENNIFEGTTDQYETAKLLNANWNITGTAVKIEQRSRYIAMEPVPIPYDPFYSQYPTSLYVFADNIPDLALDTKPHGAAQSLENIADLCTPGGQSLIAMMRESRNKERLNELGIEQDNNIPDTMSDEQMQILIANGTLPGAEEGIESPSGETYTIPAWPTTNECDGTPVAPDSNNYYDPNSGDLKGTNNKKPGTILPILNNDDINFGPNDDGTGPPIHNEDGGIDPTDIITLIIVNTEVPIGDPTTTGIGTPEFNIPEGPLDPENPNENPFINLQPFVPVLPPNLNTGFTGTTLLPSSPNISDAIDSVIDCNCDCWIN